MNAFKNPKKDKFINSFPDVAFDSGNCDHASRCKFNFSYFDSSQVVGQDFWQWDHEQLCKFFDKLKEYSRHPLSYWMDKRCGGGGRKIFEVYGAFPNNSDFTHPKFIPKSARWGRFRLEGAVRLVGFLIPNCLDGCKSTTDNFRFDANTFYIVFLDKDHRFYPVKK